MKTLFVEDVLGQLEAQGRPYVILRPDPDLTPCWMEGVQVLAAQDLDENRRLIVAADPVAAANGHRVRFSVWKPGTGVIATYYYGDGDWVKIKHI